MPGSSRGIHGFRGGAELHGYCALYAGTLQVCVARALPFGFAQGRLCLWGLYIPAGLVG